MTTAPFDPAQLPEPPAPPGQQAPPADDGGKPDTTDWKAEARKWEERAKANAKSAKQLEESQRAAMSDQDKALKDAEERGRKAASSEYGERLASTEFIAAAAKRNPQFDAAGLTDDLRLDRLLGEDGEPDLKAIQQAVERLIPEGGASIPPPMDLGEKPPAQMGGNANMNQLIRRAAGRPG